ncbi:chlorophyll a/b-binding protein [Prochlorococcus sp. MIT 1307]|nr:chlorophyll a/b-binding protein [Prochlorococcus sp. MIT 1307]
MNKNAELQNGRLAMIGFDIALITYIFTGQIIPGVF